MINFVPSKIILAIDMVLCVLFIMDSLRECESFSDAQELADWHLVENSNSNAERLCKDPTLTDLIHRSPSADGVVLLQEQVGFIGCKLLES